MTLSASVKLTTFISSLMILFGCSQKASDAYSTITTSLEQFSDVSLSDQRLSEIPYDTAYVRLNDGRQVLMVLALIETHHLTKSQRLKWVSADQAMLVTENGRIIKTLGLEGDNLASFQPTYEKGLIPISDDTQWQAIYDWQPDYRFQFSAKGSVAFNKDSVISLGNWTLNASHFTEKISFPELSSQITNEYWLNSQGKIVRSIQYLGPNMNKIEMSFVKDFL